MLGLCSSQEGTAAAGRCCCSAEGAARLVFHGSTWFHVVLHVGSQAVLISLTVQFPQNLCLCHDIAQLYKNILKEMRECRKCVFYTFPQVWAGFDMSIISQGKRMRCVRKPKEVAVITQFGLPYITNTAVLSSFQVLKDFMQKNYNDRISMAVQGKLFQ